MFGRPVACRVSRSAASTASLPESSADVLRASSAALDGVQEWAHAAIQDALKAALVDELGLSTVADLWAARPARSLPGALWRLYALREWVRRQPVQASREYAAGIRFTDVAHAVAGIAEPPGPDEVKALADDILTGVFAGDLAVALERAAAFASVISAGRADLAHDRDGVDPSGAGALTTTAAAMQRTSTFTPPEG